jgi:hypothetical protein
VMTLCYCLTYSVLQALELEKEMMQFKPIPDIVHRMLNTRVLMPPL